MKSIVLALPILLGVMPVGQSFAQTEPTQAQAIAADTRQGSYFDTAGERIFYQVTGSGTPLVLIHGYPLSGALYMYQQAGLSKHFQVITLDLPGFGKSSTPNGLASTGFYAHTVLALLDHLGIRKAIIGGHSMGGIITQELYREAPDRFAGMILIDTVSMAAPTVEKAEWIGYGLQATKQGVPSILPNIVPMLLTGDTLLDTPSVGVSIGDIIAEASVSGLQGGAETLALRPDYRSLLPTIAVPTLVLVGVDDGVYPFPIAQQLHASIKGSMLVMIPKAAHASIFEQPAAANQAISDWAGAAGF